TTLFRSGAAGGAGGARQRAAAGQPLGPSAAGLARAGRRGIAGSRPVLAAPTRHDGAQRTERRASRGAPDGAQPRLCGRQPGPARRPGPRAAQACRGPPGRRRRTQHRDPARRQRAARALLTRPPQAQAAADFPFPMSTRMNPRMRAPLICFALALAGVLYGAPAAGQDRPATAAAQDISLPVKGQHLLPLPGTPTRIAVADPAVADVKILPAAAGRPAAVMLIGKQAGTTEVQVWARGSRTPMAWTVRVAGAVQAELARRGRAGGAQGRVAGAVQAELARRGLAGEAQVDVAGAHAVVSGQSQSALAHQNAVAAAAAAVGGQQVVDVATAGPGGVVQVEVKVVELSRSVMKQVGLSMAGSAGGWGFGTRTAPDGFNVPGSIAGRG